MKRTYRLFVVTISLGLLLMSCTLSSFAINSGFLLEKVSEEDSKDLEDSLEIEYIDKLPVIEKGFESFDVNKMGDIAMEFTDIRSRNYILVFDNSGVFKYGFSYNGIGSYGLEWDGEKIVVCSVRGEWAALIDKNGEFQKVMNIQRNSENRKYWSDKIFSDRRVVNSVLYKAESSWGDYSDLIKITPDGNETTIFESYAIIGSNGLIIIGIMVFLISLILFFIKFIRTKIKANNR